MSIFAHRPAGAASTQYVGLHDPRLGGPEYEREMAELRRQQAEFRGVRRQLDLQNSWMAGVALAPAAVVAGLEGAAMFGARALAPAAPLALRGKVAFPRGGETYGTRVGRRAHGVKEAQGEGKRDWLVEETIKGPNGNVRPDLYNPRWGYVVEIKPNTPSGLLSGARSLRRYLNEIEGAKRGRIWSYDPKDPRWR